MKFRLNKTAVAAASSALLLATVPAVGMASASASSMPMAKPTYVIGYEGPLTGSNAQLGLNMVYGVQLAINNANATGKLPFKLALAKYDDQGSGTLSPAQAQAAVANSKLVAVVGPAFSGATRSAEPYYAAGNVPTVSPSATAAALTTGITRNNFMRVVYGDDVQGAADAHFLVKNRKAASVLVIDDGSFYGAGLAQVVAMDAKMLGAKVTTNSLPETCSPGYAPVSEYAAAATQIVSSKVASIFYGGYYCDFGLLLGALHTAGYKGVIMSGDGSESSSLIAGTTPKSAANGVFLSAAGGGTGGLLTGKLATQYKALSHFNAATALYASQSYDATNMIIAALQKVSLKQPLGLIRYNLVSALHAETYKGITGTLKFQTDGNLVGSGAGQIDYYQVKNGTIVLIGHN